MQHVVYMQAVNTPFEQYIRSRLIIAAAIIFGIAFAVFAGKLHGSGKTLQLFIIFGVIALTVVAIKYQERLWVLIPACWTLTGKISVLPVPFSIRDIIVMYVATVMTVCIALKLVRSKPKYTSLDVLLLLNFLWLLGVFIRNPVGVAAFDSDRVGGKPYFDALIAYVAYLVMIRIKATPQTIRQLPYFCIGAIGIVFLISAIIYAKPSLAPIAIALYSGFSLQGLMPVGNVNAPIATYETSRFAFFSEIGRSVFLLLCAYFNTFKILNPIHWRLFLAFCFACISILLSGFRSSVLFAALFFVLATYFQRSWAAAIRSILLPLPFIYLLMIGHNTLYQLPFGAQRALAFIPEILRPVEFDYYATNDADSSTRWRVEMWKDALQTNKYITNKWLGDGFGLTKWQLQVSQSLTYSGQSWEDAQESMAIAGAFHSGPISTIRYVGYIGLLLLYIFMVAMAKKSFLIIKKAKGSPYFYPAMFFGMPIVLYPLIYTFVFGSFDAAIVDIAFALGILRLIESNFITFQREKLNVATSLERIR